MHAANFGYKPDDVTVLRLLRVSRPYVLCVGTIEARKNHQVLYKAWSLLSKAGERDVPLLVIAGMPYDMDDFLDTLHRDPCVRDRYGHSPTERLSAARALRARRIHGPPVAL